MSALTIQSDEARSVAEAMTAVQARGLTRRIDDRAILDGIDLDIGQGSYVVLLGANGAGKSTLMNVLSTLSPFTDGELHLFGRRVVRSDPSVRRRLGMIGHQPMLYRELSARENLVFFGRLYGVARPAERADALLAEVALSDRAGDAAGTFSRGMVQRLAIARALMHDPDLLFADEPFAGLDLPSVQRVEQALTRLHAAGRTIVLANHDIDQSLRIGQRVVVLRRGRIAFDRPSHAVDATAVAGEVAAP